MDIAYFKHVCGSMVFNDSISIDILFFELSDAPMFLFSLSISDDCQLGDLLLCRPVELVVHSTRDDHTVIERKQFSAKRISA